MSSDNDSGGLPEQVADAIDTESETAVADARGFFEHEFADAFRDLMLEIQAGGEFDTEALLQFRQRLTELDMHVADAVKTCTETDPKGEPALQIQASARNILGNGVMLARPGAADPTSHIRTGIAEIVDELSPPADAGEQSVDVVDMADYDTPPVIVDIDDEFGDIHEAYLDYATAEQLSVDLRKLLDEHQDELSQHGGNDE